MYRRFLLRSLAPVIYLVACAICVAALDKPNQDSFTIIPTFNGDESKVFFGVFDGHGTTGDLCATFVKKECPERLTKIMEKKNCSFLEAYSKSFEDTNAKLHASRIDDSLSGTTAIAMFLDGDMIHVANVGDSRAVIATMSDGNLVAQPLSVDQTPYRSVSKCFDTLMTSISILTVVFALFRTNESECGEQEHAC